MRADLHTHSNRSDGTDSPRTLVQKAKELGLDAIALTDHDVTAGWAEAVEAGAEFGLRVIRGIEMSTGVGDTSVHLLAYEVDPDHPGLVAELEKVVTAREGRIHAIVAKLNELGVALSVEEVFAQAESAASIGRPHVADALVAAGHVKDRAEAFKTWLATGRPADVRKYRIELREAIRLVKDAGGVAVIAHPWARDSKKLMTEEFLSELVADGLRGLEVDHPDHDEAARAELAAIADRLGLVATGSSDYHGTGKTEKFSLGVNTTSAESLTKLLETCGPF